MIQADEERKHKIFNIDVPSGPGSPGVVGLGVYVGPITVHLPVPRDLMPQAVEFSNKVASAIAYHDVRALHAIIDYLEEEVNWGDPVFDETQKVLEEQLDRMSRVVVTGMLVNTGRTSFAVAGNPVLYVQTADFQYEDRKTGQCERSSTDISIRMQCVDESFVKTLPTLTVNQATAHDFVAISEDPIERMPHQDVIGQAISSERKCFIRFQRTGLKQLTSPAIMMQKKKIGPAQAAEAPVGKLKNFFRWQVPRWAKYEKTHA